MTKEIKFSGYTEQPSDYSCPDGSLSLSLGLLQDSGGAMQPLLPPKTLLTLPSGMSVVFIHKTASFTHYIVRGNANSLLWLDNSDGSLTSDGAAAQLKATSPSHSLHGFGAAVLRQLAAVGNTLVVIASDAMHYFLWETDTEGYLYLGTHLPELAISFGLQGKVKHSDTFTLPKSGDGFNTAVLAQVNKFIAENQTGSGRFILPFFVRYAYRLYDGSLTMHSAPVLMAASAGVAPNIICEKTADSGFGDCQVVAVRSFLDYAAEAAGVQRLEKWGDIVSSVDIFISQPIYTYDQSGTCEPATAAFDQGDGDLKVCYSVYHQNDQRGSTATTRLYYQKKSLYWSLRLEGREVEDGKLKYQYYIPLPRKSDEKVREEIRNCSLFYLLKSIKPGQLATTRTTMEIEDDYLGSLANREVMTDDYDSHDSLVPMVAFTYNSRLNIAGIRKSLYGGYPSMSLTEYTDGHIHYGPDTGTSLEGGSTSSLQVLVYIRQDGRDIVVANKFEGTVSLKFLPIYLYYPNTNAYKAAIHFFQGTDQYIEVPLERHNGLNGAFYFNGWQSPDETAAATAATETNYEASADTTVSVPAKIYTSGVGNPYLFPLSGINTVGTGEIMGLCAATRALSEGQFGQFPLYAFSTDGVWALEVSSTGLYSAKQPVSRDVCNNPASITPLDSSVLFATDRGIVHLAGSQTECISEDIDSDAPFAVPSLPKAKELIAVLNGLAADGGASATLPSGFAAPPLRTFLADARFIYDYAHRRVIVFSPSCESYAYAYSLRSRCWGMMMLPCGLSHPLNSYPEALAMDNGGGLVSFSRYGASSQCFLLVSRPVKLDSPDILKTIDTVILRGVFQKGHARQALYGSRDLLHWALLWSSADQYLRGFSGTPYKYFRLAAVGRLDAGESLYGCTVSFYPRLTNRPR